GVYEFVSAFFNNELDYEQFYTTIPLQEAIRIVKNDLAEEGAVFLEPLDSPSFYHKRVYEGEQNNYNMIMIVVESLSSKFLTRYGEKRNITPFLDKLAEESLFFSNLFATGTRTVRGLEALSLSLPPTPGQSIVRRKQNTGLITMGEVLHTAGYTTYFYYGGYGYFDNMNAYFEGNSHIIKDRLSVPDDEIAFGNVWGIADESLFDAVIRSVDTHTSDTKNTSPFFYTVLTTSNHRPFTYPDGRIDIPSGEGRHGAVKYTDWALQDFINKASTKPWFENTIFVIVADHTAGGAGKTTLPMRRYHIPMFVYAPKIVKAQEFSTLMSQIDVVPTLLGLLNVSYTSSFMGYDMFRLSSPEKARAFIGTYQSLGYYKDHILTILDPKERITQEQVASDLIQQTLLSTQQTELSTRAIAYYQYASYLFSSGLLRVPTPLESQD
ncbi:MAG: LTA synthase family protein, partial [Desulfovibrionaceae bacterium]|nr:LTA synthase family protein [Desulfovibrionaceae bacterium]